MCEDRNCPTASEGTYERETICSCISGLTPEAAPPHTESFPPAAMAKEPKQVKKRREAQRHTPKQICQVSRWTTMFMCAAIIFASGCGTRESDSSSSATSTSGTTTAPAEAQIAFSSQREGGNVLYLMNVDGSHQRRLTSAVPGSNAAAWSPDGSKIAFQRFGPGENLDIFTMNANGGGVKRLTGTPTEDADPSWSPDGKRICFHSTKQARSGVVINSVISVMDADGSHVMHVTDPNDEMAFDCAWAPNGRRLLFARGSVNPGGQVDGLYVTNTDGSNQEKLTARGGGRASWSPDGTRIAFAGTDGSARFQPMHLYVMNSDGSHTVRVTDNEGQELEPTWSPDGRSLAFLCECNGNADIYSVHVDGTTQRRLTHYSGSDTSPAWFGPLH